MIGGTRGTGRLIAALLLQEGRSVRVLARNSTRAIAQFGSTVEVIQGDITEESTLLPAITGASHIIFTAGCRSGRPVGQTQVRRTEFGGVVNTLAVAQRVGFSGRFLYMTASGVATRSFWAWALNVYKGNTLRWRYRAEAAIRATALPYTIIRAAMLTNAPAGQHEIEVTQQALPLSPRYRIARADVAAGFVAALEHPRTIRATFEVVWGKTGGSRGWANKFDGLRPDTAPEIGTRAV